MRVAGFIYIMSNPAFDGLLKIGKSKKDPTTDRVNELNQTGVPEPFEVEYYAFVENEDLLELKLHKFFRTKRPNKNREFFNVDCLTANNAVRQLSMPDAEIKYEEVFYLSEEELKHHREEQIKRDTEQEYERQAEERKRKRRDYERKQEELVLRVQQNKAQLLSLWKQFALTSLFLWLAVPVVIRALRLSIEDEGFVVLFAFVGQIYLLIWTFIRRQDLKKKQKAEAQDW